MQLNRRAALSLMTAASAMAASGAGWAAEGDRYDLAKLMSPAGGWTDRVLGSPDAPVTVIEYASTTCPHCAAFNNDVLPAFKAQYVDTGKVKYIVRPFARDNRDAAVFILAGAAGPEHFNSLLDAFFRTQEQWAFVENAQEPIFNIAQQFGFTRESFEATLKDPAAQAAQLTALGDQAINEIKREGTPTFYINGKQLTGEKSLADLAAEIDPLIPADFKPTEAAAQSPAATTTATTPPAESTAATSTTDGMAPAATTTNTMAPAAPAAATSTAQ